MITSNGTVKIKAIRRDAFRILKYLICILLTLFAANLFSQPIAGVVSGRVTDEESGQPLWAAGVEIKAGSTTLSTATDSNGLFQFKGITPGRISIKASFLGYAPVLLNDLLLSSGKGLQLELRMSEQLNKMNELEIISGRDRSRAGNEFAGVSSRSFSVEDTRRYPATLNDPARMVQSFAGVASSGDDNNAIVVRGNSPQGMLWRLEGLEIPNPNHFAGSEGATGGGVSMLSANMLGNTDFYSGAFAAEFGNALSGVFDLHLRKGQDDKRHYTLQAGVLGLEAAAEGPFKKGKSATYLINYRYSTLEILSLMGFKIGGTVIPKYQDLACHFYLPTKKAGTFGFYGLGGISSLGSSATADSSLWLSPNDRQGFNQFYRMGTSGLSHMISLKNKKTYFKSSVSFNYQDNGFRSDTLDDTYTARLSVNERYRYYIPRLSFVVNHKFRAGNLMRAGAYANLMLFQPERADPRLDAFFLKGSLFHQVLIQAYWQWKIKPKENLEIVSGCHLSWSSITRRLYAEPRLSVLWQPTTGHRLSLGLGLHNRNPAPSLFLVQLPGTGGTQPFLPNRDLQFARAFHAVTGYDFVFKKDFRLRSEIYFQWLYGIPAASDSNSWFSLLNVSESIEPIALQNVGSGLNYGLELTLEKFFGKHYYFMFTTSLFRSLYHNPGMAAWQSTAYDFNYVMNAMGGKEFVVGKRKINLLSINMRLLWRGGSRETPILEEESKLNGTAIYDRSKMYSDRLSDYFRADLGLSFRRNKKKYSWLISLDAQNLINRRNDAIRVFNPYSGQTELRKNLGIIPVLSYRIEF